MPCRKAPWRVPANCCPRYNVGTLIARELRATRLSTGSITMKYHAAGFAAVITILNGLCGPQAGAETIATLTKGQSNPIVRGVRVGSETMAGKLGDKTMHFVPRTENSVPEQISLVEDVLGNKPDALVFS